MCRDTILIKRKVTGAILHSRDEFTYKVPCGKCPICVKAKVNSWLFRLDQELKRSVNPLFVTLTYNEETVPHGNDCLTLCKKDLQNFFKRLRKSYEKTNPNAPKIKYYACGEYGSKTKRPHYHIILFNLQNSDLVHKAWGNGFTMSAPLRDGGTTYVLKYMHKVRQKKTLGRRVNFLLCQNEWEKIILHLQLGGTTSIIWKTLSPLLLVGIKCLYPNTIKRNYIMMTNVRK